MPDNTEVSLAVRWAESGADVPARTAASLRSLSAAASEASVGVGERMAQAFQRLEAREPTMAMRRTRLAIEELSVSALGIQGPMGRLASSFALLAPGGALTLGAVAGLAAIAVEVKDLITYGD